MHDACPPLNDAIKQGDQWLKGWIAKIKASPVYARSAVFVTWDEPGALGSISNAPIGMIVLSPFGTGHHNAVATAYTHSSTLRTMQDIFHVSPYIRDAANATKKDRLQAGTYELGSIFKVATVAMVPAISGHAYSSIDAMAAFSASRRSSH